MPDCLPTDSTQARSHRTKPEHGVETRTRLLEIACDLFARDGYGGVALEDVVAAGGVTRGALYHHFHNKQDLFRAVCEVVAGGISERIMAAAESESDPMARLRAGCRAFLDASAEPVARRILLTDAPSVLGWQTLRAIDAVNGLGLLRRALQRAMDGGQIQPGPVDTLAHMLAAALQELAMLIGPAEDPDQAHQDALASVDRLLAGLAGRPA